MISDLRSLWGQGTTILVRRRSLSFSRNDCVEGRFWECTGDGWVENSDREWSFVGVDVRGRDTVGRFEDFRITMAFFIRPGLASSSSRMASICNQSESGIGGSTIFGMIVSFGLSSPEDVDERSREPGGPGEERRDGKRTK